MPGLRQLLRLFTANTMNCLTEVLGMGLPGNGTIPAAYNGKRIALAKHAAWLLCVCWRKTFCLATS